METVREIIFAQMRGNEDLDKGYAEMYPYWIANWEVVGGKFEPDFNFNKIVNITKMVEEMNQ